MPTRGLHKESLSRQSRAVIGSAARRKTAPAAKFPRASLETLSTGATLLGDSQVAEVKTRALPVHTLKTPRAPF